MKTINVGIVGYGNIAQKRHIPGYQKDTRVTIEAIVGPDKAKAKSVALKFRIPNYYDNLEQMLERNLDVISVCTPPGTHAEIARKALAAGCHVLVEKPMAMNSTEASQMIADAEKYNRKLCVVHNFLFSKSMQKVKEMHRDGQLGDIQDVTAVQLSSEKRVLPIWYPSLPGKLFFDEIPHMIYSINEFIPNLDIKDILKVSLAKNYPSDNIYVDFSSENIIGSLKMIFNAPSSEWKILITGTKKIVLLDLFRDSYLMLSEEKSHLPFAVLSSSLDLVRQTISNDFSSGMRLLSGNLLFGHDLLIKKFIDSIQNHTPTPVDPKDGLKVLTLTEHIIHQLNYCSEQSRDYSQLRI